MTARLLIPTRNRPSSLASVIAFLEAFYPAAEVVVADGSSEEFAAQNAAMLQSAARTIAVDYRSFPPDLPLFDRLLTVLGDMDDDLVIMASDDDFPLLDTLAAAEQELRAEPSAATAMGAKLGIDLYAPGDVDVSLRISRQVAGKTALGRARRYVRWPFSTTHAVTRRAVLVERYTWAAKHFNANTFDHLVGLADAMRGPIITLPAFGFVITRNATHSYLRTGGGLGFLRDPEHILTAAGDVAEKLTALDGLGLDDAMEAADILLRPMIAQCAGFPMRKRRDIQGTQEMLDWVVRDQMQRFRDVLTPHTPTAQEMAPKLRFILDALHRTAASDDNRGEPATVDSLAAQIEEIGGSTKSSGRDEMIRAKAYRDPLDFTRKIDVAAMAYTDDHFVPLHLIALGDRTLANHWQADEPLAHFKVLDGVDDAGGFWPALARKLRLSEAGAPLHLTTVTRYGSVPQDWCGGGELGAALETHLEATAPCEGPTIALWCLGPSVHDGNDTDNAINSLADYEAAFAHVHQILARHRPEALILVCRSATRAGVEDQALAELQSKLVDAYERCGAGPNIDAALARPIDDPRGTEAGDGTQANRQALADALFHKIWPLATRRG